MIAVLGAGMAGLAAAGILHEEGLPVCVLEKSRGVGGRCATRRFGGAVFDHGAQFYTARLAPLTEQTLDWLDRGIVAEWFLGGKCSGRRSGSEHPRYRGVPSMTAMAKDLSKELDVRTGCEVKKIVHRDKGWDIKCNKGVTLRADVLIATAPVPQTMALFDEATRHEIYTCEPRLAHVAYDPCFAVLVRLDGPSAVPAPGAVQPGSGMLAWVADNAQKGVSPGPGALTLHSTAAFAETHFDEPPDMVGRLLLAEASDWLGAEPIDFQVHRWRYAKPREPYGASCIELELPGRVFIAGDAFDGPRVEGAVISGMAAASAFLSDPAEYT